MILKYSINSFIYNYVELQKVLSRYYTVVMHSHTGSVLRDSPSAPPT